MSSADAIAILQANACNRAARESLLHSGYPGYDTSVGWMAYDNEKIREMMDKAISQGFHAFQLKVGSKDEQRDLRRAAMLRERVGDDGIVMFDANQRWNLPDAIRMGRELGKFKPLWLEEPTHHGWKSPRIRMIFTPMLCSPANLLR